MASSFHSSRQRRHGSDDGSNDGSVGGPVGVVVGAVDASIVAGVVAGAVVNGIAGAVDAFVAAVAVVGANVVAVVAVDESIAVSVGAVVDGDAATSEAFGAAERKTTQLQRRCLLWPGPLARQQAPDQFPEQPALMEYIKGDIFLTISWLGGHVLSKWGLINGFLLTL